MAVPPDIQNDPAGHESLTQLPISVIVNTCDRRDALRTLLYSLNRQTHPHFEVVVVVGPTTDDTVEMLAGEFGDQVRVARCSQFNLSSSRNVGLAHASGDVVAFIDDDAVPCSTWLQQLATAYSDPAVAGVGGRTYNVLPDSGELQFLRGMFSVLGEQEDVRKKGKPPQKTSVPLRFWFPRFHGTNMSYRRDVLIEIKGFDERFEYLFDDSDVAARLAREGFLLHQLAEAVVYHAPESGRNRGKHKYDLNWYCWLRSTVYFALKNGIPTIGLPKSIVGASKTVSSFYAHVEEAYRKGGFPDELHRRARRNLRRGWVEGFLQGLFLRRKFPRSLQLQEHKFSPFLRQESPTYRSVMPIESNDAAEVRIMDREPLRICLLSVGYPPRDTHGVSRSTHTLALGLVHLGHEVHIITAGDRSRVITRDGAFIHEVNGANSDRYHSYAARGYQNLAHWLNHSHAVFDRIRSLQLNHNIQIVDSPLWNLDGLVTAVSGTVPVAVRVVTAMKQIAAIHGREDDETSLLAELEGEFLRMASAVISNSQGTVQTLQEVYELELDAALHHMASYGVVPAADDDVPEERAQQPEQTTVLFVGRLEGRKGILDLFEAIPEVLRLAPQTRFQIVGSDNSLEDGFRATHRRDYASFFNKKHPACAGQVEFLGFVDESRLQELYRDCDVFVAPSHYESFGLIFLEAMNYARPVIGCRSGGPKDIIADGETGLLVPPQDPSALAEAIVRLVSSPDQRREMGLAGRQRLLERYSHIAMAERFVEVYRMMLNGPSGHHPDSPPVKIPGGIRGEA
jgi:glycosyltransferase involved in cell wall biosynthesis